MDGWMCMLPSGNIDPSNQYSREGIYLNCVVYCDLDLKYDLGRYIHSNEADAIRSRVRIELKRLFKSASKQQ